MEAANFAVAASMKIMPCAKNILLGVSGERYPLWREGGGGWGRREEKGRKVECTKGCCA